MNNLQVAIPLSVIFALSIVPVRNGCDDPTQDSSQGYCKVGVSYFILPKLCHSPWLLGYSFRLDAVACLDYRFFSCFFKIFLFMVIKGEGGRQSHFRGLESC